MKSTAVQYNSWHRGLAWSEQERRVTDRRREKRREMSELKDCQQQETETICRVTQAWHWWQRFWFLAGCSKFYLGKKTTQWCLGSSSFFLITDDLITLDRIPNSCCNFRVPFYVWVRHSKTNSASSSKRTNSGDCTCKCTLTSLKVWSLKVDM